MDFNEIIDDGNEIIDDVEEMYNMKNYEQVSYS